jgi:peptidoglycan-associated lipoprotein
MELPSDFINMLSGLLPEGEAAELFEALRETPLPVSIRLNPDKVGLGEVLDFLGCSTDGAVPWASDAFYLDRRPLFTLDPKLHQGVYYVQEASSMFMEQAVRSCVSGPVTFLDLCAAPGGKSTHIASLLPEGSILVAITGVKSCDIFLSVKDENGKWTKPKVIENGPNSEFEDGSCALSPDFSVMYFTYCPTDPQLPRPATIMKSARSDASWSTASPYSDVEDSLYNYAHPAVSPDGQWLYFVSDMDGGYGGMDLWRVPIGERLLGGENLGPDINTPGNEMFPTFRRNGELYFSSDGHPGMGGLDIFRAVATSDTTWNVTNMRAPLNSQYDDFGMTFEGDYTRGFFSSNRGDARGRDHIWTFELPETVHNLIGWVYEKDGYELPGAIVHLVGNDGTNMKITVRNDGSFTQRITPGVSYLLLGTSKGYMNYMQEMTADSTEQDREYVLQFPLSSISKPVLIDNIFFDFDRATLRPESTESLDELVTLLENNPGVTIEIGAHCDYKGNDNYNRRLSQQRSESVVQYLIAHGIDKERLTAHGYGETQPKVISRKIAEEHDFLNEGDTLTEEFILKLSDEQQEICNQLNRRTEFRVIRTTYGLFGH